MKTIADCWFESKFVECMGLLSIIAFSIIIRILVLYDPKADEITYLSLAHAILHGQGFSINEKLTSFFPPLYPYFLSFIFYIFGENIFYAKVIQIILGSLTCIPLYFIGRFLFSKKNAFISTLFFSVYISLVYIHGRLVTETLFSFLMVIFIFLFLVGRRFTSIFMCGIFLGLATLTRPSLLYLPILLVIFILISKTYKKIWIVVAMFLTILPWTVRNYFVHKDIVLITTYNGYLLYNSSHPVDGKKFGFMTPVDDIIQKSEQIPSEVEQSRFLYQEGIKSIIKNPLNYARLGFLKILFFWIPFDWEMIHKEGKAVFNFSYAFIFPFFLLAAFQIFNKNSNFHSGHYFILSLFVYFCLLSVISYGSPRFRVPLEPYIILFGIQGLLMFYNYFGWKASSLISALFLLLNLHVYQHTAFYKMYLSSFFSMIGLW